MGRKRTWYLGSTGGHFHHGIGQILFQLQFDFHFGHQIAYGTLRVTPLRAVAFAAVSGQKAW